MSNSDRADRSPLAIYCRWSLGPRPIGNVANLGPRCRGELAGRDRRLFAYAYSGARGLSSDGSRALTSDSTLEGVNGRAPGTGQGYQR